MRSPTNLTNVSLRFLAVASAVSSQSTLLTTCLGRTKYGRYVAFFAVQYRGIEVRDGPGITACSDFLGGTTSYIRTSREEFQCLDCENLYLESKGRGRLTVQLAPVLTYGSGCTVAALVA